MKKWNMPEVEELSFALTAGCNGNTPKASDKNYKKKTQQCECGHNTNFQFDPTCPDCGNGYEGDDDATDNTSL